MENNCIFCKIVKGEIPCYKVYEDENFLAFLDVFPRVKGHTLVIPKKHFKWTYDVPNFGEYWEAVKTVTKKIQNSLQPKFVTYLTIGVDVPHAHIHILPRFESTFTSAYPEQIKISKEELAELTKKIGTAS
jgi:histidine triad (HIT) family protein